MNNIVFEHVVKAYGKNVIAWGMEDAAKLPWWK